MKPKYYYKPSINNDAEMLYAAYPDGTAYYAQYTSGLSPAVWEQSSVSSEHLTSSPIHHPVSWQDVRLAFPFHSPHIKR